MRSVLFVCTANRARSPFAAACLRKEIAGRGLAGEWRVFSAGTWTENGLPAVPDALASAQRLGIDLSEHASQAITAELLRQADVVILMERGQREALGSEFPESQNKLYLLSEVATGRSYDIPDLPKLASGADVYVEIESLVRASVDRISELADP
jgi:protein-tyrosine phosphatase